jgi:hypothetical protein
VSHLSYFRFDFLLWQLLEKYFIFRSFTQRVTPKGVGPFTAEKCCGPLVEVSMTGDYPRYRAWYSHGSWLNIFSCGAAGRRLLEAVEAATDLP